MTPAPMPDSSMSYASRLLTFVDYWNDHQATANQLAAMGHVYDRPPLETFDEGSRCIECAAFAPREESIRALEGPVYKPNANVHISRRLHDPGCHRLQCKNPLDPQNTYTLPGAPGSGTRFEDLRKRFDHWGRRFEPITSSFPNGQSSPLFKLPVEIRLQIYSMILPTLDRTTTIVPLNKDSGRIITSTGFDKRGPRDATKIHLLSTCRAVHEEAADILFSKITYTFHSTKTLYLFLRHIGAHGRRLLRSVDVIAGGREDAITFALLGACPKLQCVTIRLPRPKLLFPGARTWHIDGMATLLDISGLETVRLGSCDTKWGYLEDGSHDARILRRELTRPKGEPGQIRWVNGTLDI